MKRINRLLQQTFLPTACAGVLLGAISLNAATTPLVNHGDNWHLRKGTNTPQADWKDAAEANLDETWQALPGGFGFGDLLITGEATTLADMQNGYSTIYIRKSFAITSPVDTNLHLQLVMDYDDGFIAYLDGVPIDRANVTNQTTATFPFNATTGGTSHEASCCNSGNPRRTNNLGAVGARLGVGTHVLALHGINQAIDSSDFHLIADLYLTDPVLPQAGQLTINTTWTPAMSPIVLVTNIHVPTNVTLTLLPGTVVEVANGVAIRAIAGGTIDIAGTGENPVVLRSQTPGTTWRELSAQFPGASMSVRHGDISGTQVTIYSNAVGVLEDSFFHDYRITGTTLTQPIILTHFAAPVLARRIHVREYHETLWRNGVITIEGSLFERVHGDAVDFDAAQPGSVIRDCTFRHGTNGNVDAVDIGPADLPGSFDVRVENCVMFDFPFDKGVSVGDNGDSHGSIVSNCLIYACRSGVMAKDLCDVSVRNCTIVMVTNALIPHAWGLTNYNKVNPGSATGGGITTNSYNNIVWGIGTTISMVNSGQLYADHNILWNTNWPGDGNVSVNPMFLDPSLSDYRLAVGSPAFGLGRDGANLGATFPIGSPLAPSHPRIESVERQANEAVLRFWADNEKTYTVQRSDKVTGGAWTKVLDIGLGSVPRHLSITNAVPADANAFFRLVTPSQ